MPNDEMARYKDIFISEAQEHLQSLNQNLLQLEKTPDDVELLNEIFRLAHTLKGMAATMGYQKITTLAHQMEDVLDKLRKQEVKVNTEISDTLFKCLDILDQLLQEVITNQDRNVDLTNIIERLKVALTIEQEILSITEKESVPQATPTTAAAESAATAVTEKKKTQSVRINIQHLDKLMNLVGELVINKARLAQIVTAYKIAEFSEAFTQLERVTSNLQEEVLKTRMIPVAHIFERFPRVVRDLAKLKNKDINFEMYGLDIELDRIIIDEINEPLIHLIRNAVDHGIESPQDRTALGKPAHGQVKLSAKREKGYVKIELSDDGKGMDPKDIVQKAVEKGIVLEEKAKQMDDNEKLMLICDPRFSTAKEITDISGRGVGMDVVKTKVEAFNGSLTIETKKGAGTNFILKLPITLAIIQALLVKVEQEIYAIPLTNVTEIVSIVPQDIKTIETREVIRLRQEILPIKNLREIFDLPKRQWQKEEELYVVAVEVGEKRLGVIVDSLVGREEIVIKTLGGILKKTKGFSGATILGDGRVVLIVDVASLT